MEETRNRIIDAASQLFAERGLKGTTVRAICHAAGVNVALINYYFKTKVGLYEACIQRIFATSGGQRLASVDKEVSDEKSWRHAVTEWIHGFSAAMHERSAGGAGPVWVFRQEVTHPSEMYNYLKKNFGMPVFNCLKRLLMMATGSEREALLWMVSIWSQLSAPVLVNEKWHDVFRPSGTDRAQWSDAFEKFVLDSLFRELRYHG